MFCSKCGSEIDASARFCYKCGAAIAQIKQDNIMEYTKPAKAEKGKTALLLVLVVLVIAMGLLVKFGKDRGGTVLRGEEKESVVVYNDIENQIDNEEMNYTVVGNDNTQTSMPKIVIEEQKDEEFYIALYKTWASKAREYCLKPFGTADSMDMEDICIVYRIIEYINAEQGGSVSYTYNTATEFFEIEGRVVHNTLHEKTSIIGYEEREWFSYYNILGELVYDEEQDKFFFNTLYEEVPRGKIKTVDVIEMSSGFVCVTIYWSDETIQQLLFDGENPDKFVSYESIE